MPDKFAHIIPFMAITGVNRSHWHVQRIVEALIIAGIAGGVSVWGTQQYMDAKIGMIEQQLYEVKADIQQMRDDFYVPRFGGDK
jgi:uncharacterized membrane protein YidH (DUF202 family)